MKLADHIHRLKVLAGIYQPYDITAPSRMEENLSHIGTEKAELQRKYKIEPGTEAWFKLWFSRPHLTGKTGHPGEKK